MLAPHNYGPTTTDLWQGLYYVLQYVQQYRVLFPLQYFPTVPFTCFCHSIYQVEADGSWLRSSYYMWYQTWGKQANQAQCDTGKPDLMISLLKTLGWFFLSYTDKSQFLTRAHKPPELWSLLGLSLSTGLPIPHFSATEVPIMVHQGSHPLPHHHPILELSSSVILSAYHAAPYWCTWKHAIMA